jgi:hypothetical protein
MNCIIQCKAAALGLRVHLLLIFAIQCIATVGNASSVEGRWDLTFERDNWTGPGWLEVCHSGHSTLVGRIMVFGGSARPISEIKLVDGKTSFSIPPQWERGITDIVFEGLFVDDQLMGTMVDTDGHTYVWKGVRAPELRREKEPTWGPEIQLFDGQSTTGWKATGKKPWIVEDDILKSVDSGSNLMTEDVFDDFKLHIEFRVPKGGNSGVYLRGRYEVQIEDSEDRGPFPVYLGSIYGLLTPNQMVAKSPGEWQSFDITLVGRTVTVVAIGITIICEQVIPGITGGAINSNEGEPGPILLQGDHGPIEFRNIVMRRGW